MASPQTIQPATSDTYIDSNASTTNYSTNTSLYTGHEDGAPSITRKTLLAFDFSAIVPAGATITTATLSLYLFEHDDDSDGTNITVYRLLRTDEDDSQATWAVYKTGSSWTTGGCGSAVSDYTTTASASVALPNPITNNSWIN